MNKDLFLSILSLDSYNRGNNARISDLNTEKIGSSTFFRDISYSSADFYASSYSIQGVDGISDGSAVISFRGTDNLTSDFWSYGLAIGDPYNESLSDYGATTGLTVSFFKDTRIDLLSSGEPFNGTIVMTGHSLGGGLAGYVAGLYGLSATIFDNMTFNSSVINTYNDSISAETTGPQALRNLVYGNGPISSYSFNGIEAFATTGEFLTFTRGSQIPSTQYLDSNGGLRSPLELHSMALHVALQYANQLTDQSWANSVAADALWDAFFGDMVSDAISDALNRRGTDQNNAPIGTAAEVIQAAIAYSALSVGNDEGKPFGDTGIVAMFDDANDLGRLLTEHSSWTWLNDNAQSLATYFVHFAGKMAMGDVEGDDEAKAGVLATDDDAKALVINTGDHVWGKGEEPNGDDRLRLGLDGFVAAPLNGIGFIRDSSNPNFGSLSAYRPVETAAELRQALVAARSDYESTVGLSMDASMFDRFVFIAPGETSVKLADRKDGGDGMSLIVTTDAAEAIIGSQDNELISSGAGNDSIAGGGGANVLDGGEGEDVADYSAATNGGMRAHVGDSENTNLPKVYGPGGGSDYLLNIEKVIGTSFNDVIELKSFSNASSFQYIDLLNNVSNSSYADTIDLSQLNMSATVDLRDSLNQLVVASSGTQDGVLHVRNAGAVFGSAYDDVMYANNQGSQLWGNGGADTLYGGSGNDVLKGGTYVTGGAGNDLIDARSLGAFNPATVYFNIGDGHDTIISDEMSPGSSIYSGIDKIDLSNLSMNSVSIIWDAQIVSQENSEEYTYYSASGDLAIVIGEGDSILIKGVSGTYRQPLGEILELGQDFEPSISVPDLIFSDGMVRFGNEIANIPVYFGPTSQYDFASAAQPPAIPGMLDRGDQTGTASDDNLEANDIRRIGTDRTIDGGEGNDTVSLFGSLSDYTISSASIGFTIAPISGDGSILLRNVENVRFLAEFGTFTIADLMATTGSEGHDVLLGTTRADRLYGRAGDDTLTGGAGNDLIDGGNGTDTAQYSGSSTDYRIGWYNGRLSIEDLREGTPDGRDLLTSVEAFRFAGDSITLTLDDVVELGEELFEQIDYITGTERADRIEGANGQDNIDAGAGDDVIKGFGEHDIIDGGDGFDEAVYIGKSSDYFAGSFGSFVSVSDYSEENRDGFDQLSNVESLYFEGDGLRVAITQIEIGGTAGDDTLSGTTLGETLSGLGGNDILNGGDGPDTLNGGEGADTLIGGNGDDYYIVENSGDVVVESIGSGYDIVESSISYTLPDNVEELDLYGDDDVNGTGNALDNDIWGDDNINILSGLAGDDYLVGGSGDDILVGGMGDDTLEGDDGDDTALFSGFQSDYTISTAGGSIYITDDDALDGDDGSDQLLGIENAQFTDGQVSLAAPIVLDLDGNGVSLVNRGRSKARFDWNGDGKADRTGWISKKDGFLVFDRNGNGKVDNANELSFVGDKEGAQSDLDGLSAFDSNGDGLFSAADEKFADFRVWRDKNGNGRSDRRELVSLSDAGIASIDLKRNTTDRSWDWEDNLTLATSTFTRTNGSVGQVGDVALNYSATRTKGTLQAASRLAEAIAAFNDNGGGDQLQLFHEQLERRESFFAGKASFR